MSTTSRHTFLRALWRHPLMVVVCNLLVVMLVLTLSRIVFYLANRSLFGDITLSHLWEMLVGGLRFDLTAMLYLNSLYILLMLLPLPTTWRNNAHYQRVARGWYLFANSLMLVLNAGDTMYIPFSDRRATWSLFTEFGHDSNLLSIFGQSIVHNWPITLATILLIITLVLLSRKRSESANFPPAIYYPAETIILLLCAYMTVIGIRGGFGKYTRPITNSNALQYTNTARETAIVLNTPFSLMMTIEHSPYQNPHYYSEDELPLRMSPLHPACVADSVRTDNVVILILESFSKEYIGFFNRDLDDGTYRGYTPFLDSLLMHSITYECSFASGRKSIDAMPSIVSSIPMLIEPYIVSAYSTNTVSSIADCLKRKGYTTAFYHGAPNGSMGFEAYARQARYDSYRGMNEYDGPSAFDGTWAIWDEEFLGYYGRDISLLPEPWCTTVFTASSHHPFRVPSRYDGQFSKGTKEIHQCIGYSDMALRKFFAYAQTQSWFDHTLFVLTADHTNEMTHPEYTNAAGLFTVPIAFYHAGWQGELRKSEAVSQTDIMPSILGYLGYDLPYFSFGEDALMQQKEHPWAVCYDFPYYQIFSDSLLLQYDGQTVRGLYRYRTDRTLSHDLSDEFYTCTSADSMAEADITYTDFMVNSTYVEASAMLQYLQAYIQQYIECMTSDQLTYPEVLRK